jgi:hypothetical protein
MNPLRKRFFPKFNLFSSPLSRDEKDRTGFSAGYRLRFRQPAARSFHYDMDLNVGTKLLRSHTYLQVPEVGATIYTHNTQNLYTSLTLTANYSIFKNFSAGLGIEPSRYFRLNKYDVPLVAKSAYSLKVTDSEVTGKYGLQTSWKQKIYAPESSARFNAPYLFLSKRHF